mmetsp:Transcript_74726/g.188141  ORF Transcript_74726/g.188141 Transcript_74726/m.188141 type:complete len:110 (-) Transcript_74726:1236-1565(-)
MMSAFALHAANSSSVHGAAITCRADVVSIFVGPVGHVEGKAAIAAYTGAGSIHLFSIVQVNICNWLGLLQLPSLCGISASPRAPWSAMYLLPLASPFCRQHTDVTDGTG